VALTTNSLPNLTHSSSPPLSLSLLPQGNTEVVEEVGAMLVEKLPVFIQSGDLEVQERACCILQLMKYIVKLQGKGAAVANELVALFAGDLNPVAAKAQKKVPVPEG